MDAAKSEVSKDQKSVTVIHGSDHRIKHSIRWLRLHCKCKTCKQPFSGMYPLDAMVLDDELNVKSAVVSDNTLKCIVSAVASPDHEIEIPFDYLVQTCNCATCLAKERERKRPQTLNRNSILYMDYSEVEKDEGMFRCLNNIVQHGYCVLENSTIKDKEEIMAFGKRFGCRRTTFYGDVFDVESTLDPINVAYTNVSLDSHQDLHYYETSPGVQYLFAKRFDDVVDGGHTKLADTMECAAILRKKHPELFDVLCRVPVTYRSKDMSIPSHYEQTKPIIDVDYFGEIVAVQWIPLTESVLRAKCEDMEAFYKAHKILHSILNDPQNQCKFRMNENDLLVFNNRRLVHARGAYNVKGTGKRHLYGMYTNIDDLRSKYMVYARKLGREMITPRLGNRGST